MRKALLYIGILVFSAVSCSKWSGTEKEQITVPEGKYLFTLRATTDDFTKTYYSEEKYFRWSDNDEISVLFHNTAAGHENENDFYTLKTSTGGTSAEFSGYIDEGWEIGASDTGTKWALYPAGSHSYSVGDTYPTFNVPTVTDFTASHVSANLPMVTDGVGGYKFSHVTNAFKFTFTNIDVSKVKLIVENQGSLNLSGDVPVIFTDKYYLDYPSGGTSTSKSLTLIKDVTSKTVEFYIPYRAYNYAFQPQLTLYDATTNYLLKTVTAANDFTTISTGGREFKDRRIIVVPYISAPGTGVAPFVPLIDIDGDMSDWNPSTNAKLTGSNIASATGNSYFKELKVAYDDRYIYFYVKRNRTRDIWEGNGYYYFFLDTDNVSSNGHTVDGSMYDYGFYLFPFAGSKGADEASSVPGFNKTPSTNLATEFSFTLGGGFSTLCDGTASASEVETEIRILRSDLGIDKDDIISVASYGNKNANYTPYTKITGLKIDN